MSIVLITGSCGLVGSESVEYFSNKGFDIIGIDNNLRRFFFGKDGDTNWVKKKLKTKFKNYKHFNLDIRSKDQIENIFKKYKKKIELIIHAAAQPSHDWAKNYIKIDFEVNASATLNMLEATRKYSPETPFIFLSTNKVYGDNPNHLPLIEKIKRWEIKKTHKYFQGIDESMSIDNCVHSFFGASKAYADLLVQEYGKNYDLKTSAFRAGCITGPNHSGAKLHGFLSFLVKCISSKKRYFINGYLGKQVRDNIHSSDLTSCFWEFYKKPKKGVVYNIGGGRKSNCSILEAISLIEEKTKNKSRIKILKQNRVGDHIWYISNLKKFKSDYPNWKQKYNTSKILEELLIT